jgi:hypothetical protein
VRTGPELEHHRRESQPLDGALRRSALLNQFLQSGAHKYPQPPVRGEYGLLIWQRLDLQFIPHYRLYRRSTRAWRRQYDGRWLLAVMTMLWAGPRLSQERIVGAMAIGALAIRALAVKRGRIERLNIEELEVVIYKPS